MEMLCAGPVDDIDALIAECQFTAEEQQQALFLVESFPAYVIVNPQERQDLLRFWHFDAHISFANYTSGRIFHPNFELRWEQNNGKIQAVYLGTERSLPSLKVVRDLNLEKSEQRYYYLFGEYLEPGKLEKMGLAPSPGYYAEVRIPRLLRYPAPVGARRVRLTVCEYLEETTGKVELFRFQGLEAAE